MVPVVVMIAHLLQLYQRLSYKLQLLILRFGPERPCLFLLSRLAAAEQKQQFVLTNVNMECSNCMLVSIRLLF